MPRRALGLTALTSLLLVTASPAVMTFTVSFTAQAQSDLSAAEQDLFNTAVQFWDDIIDGHRDGVDRTWNLNVNTFSQASSGGGVVLGSAGASGLAFSGVVGDSHTSNGRFIISTAGSANFNVHADAGPLDLTTITHEIGHALGIGTLWEDNEIYNDGVGGNHNRTLSGGIIGQLVGPNTLAAYQNEFDSGATFVPVELDGGPGSAHAHWNSSTDHFASENVLGFDSDPGDGGPAPTSGGNSLNDELFTSVQTGSSWLSETSRANLIDIGFTVHPMPEPGTTALLGASLLLLAFQRRRS